MTCDTSLFRSLVPTSSDGVRKRSNRLPYVRPFTAMFVFYTLVYRMKGVYLKMVAPTDYVHVQLQCCTWPMVFYFIFFFFLFVIDSSNYLLLLFVCCLKTNTNEKKNRISHTFNMGALSVACLFAIAI